MDRHMTYHYRQIPLTEEQEIEKIAIDYFSAYNLNEDKVLEKKVHVRSLRAALQAAYDAGYYAPADSYREALEIAMRPVPGKKK
jgi:hypothetical protein